MSFFEAQPPSEASSEGFYAPAGGAGRERGARGAVPDRMAEEMARCAAYLAAREADAARRKLDEVVEVDGKVIEARGRSGGLTIEAVLDRKPRGMLFRIGVGFFDLDGFWCIPKADKSVEVRRGCSKEQMRRLSDHQRREVERVRLNARRNGVR